MSYAPRSHTDAIRRRLGRAATAGIAVIAAVVIWAVATRLLGIEVRSPEMGGQPPTDITLSSVVAASGLAALAGWGLLAILERVTRHAARVWLVTALVALVASLGGPLGGSGISATNRAVLLALHAVVAAIVILGLLRNPEPARTLDAEDAEHQEVSR